jgi:broad specificity phosphatase PhoE
MSQQFTTFYVARHGETEYNADGILQGITDSPLTPNGIRQAKELGAKLQGINFDLVYASDLLRAQKTAELATLEKNLIINTSRLLRERNYGSFDGKASTLYRDTNNDIIEKMKALSFKERKKFRVADDMESDEEVSDRLMLFIRETAVTYPGKNILVVSHGGIMRMFLVHLGWASYKDLPGGTITNTAYIKLRSDGTDFFIDEVSGIEKIIPEQK